MTVIWMPLAKAAFRNTAKYIRKEFGSKVRDSFVQEVLSASRLIGSNPEMGKIEPTLEELPNKYRSLVVSNINKIVYRILNDRIEISDFWNCRRNPETLSAQIKKH